MTVKQKYFQAIESLKVLNQAVTTSRLYPAVSPQVSLAVEKAYKEIKDYCRKNGELSFGKNGESSLLCGLMVPETLSDELHDLTIFRQLELLKIDHVVLRTGFDRVVFGRILSVFLARKEKINREGGGRPFVNGLGLIQFFPEEYEPSPDVSAPEEEQDSGQLKIDREVLPDDQFCYLLGEHKRKAVLEILLSRFSDKDEGVDIIVAGIGRVLQKFANLEDDVLVISASYSRFLDTAGKLLTRGDKEVVAGSVVEKVLEGIDAHQLCELCAQKYHEGFGELFFSALLNTVSNDLFADVIELLRNREHHLHRQRLGETPQAALVTATLAGLLESVKGKQFLGREKAQSLIQAGEQERQTKRLETGVSSLLQGNTESLQSDEFVFSLPSTVDKLVSDGQLDTAGSIIDKIAAEMLGGDDTLRKRLIQGLILIGEKLLDEKRWGWLERITGALVSWVRESDDGDFVYEKSVSILQAIMDHSWENGQYSRGDQILSVLHKIRSGQLQKSAPVRALIGRIQDRSFSRPQIELFLTSHLAEQGNGQFGQRLCMLGRPAANHLIDVLLENESTEERLKIAAVLANMGQVALPVLVSRLQEPMPWYGKRNLIKLIAEVAGPEQVDVVIPFLQHEDIRVQREAFVCIYVISADQRRSALVKCLGAVSEVMCIQVVKALLPYSDDEIAERLGTLLEDQKNYSDNVREPLVLEILKVLARSKSEKGRIAVLRFLDQKTEKANRRLKDSVWQKAQSVLREIEVVRGLDEEDGTGETPGMIRTVKAKAPEAVHVSSGVSSGKAPHPAKPVKNYAQMPGAAKVEALLARGMRDQARDLLVDFVTRAARDRKFNRAEKYREWLMDVDPMGLTEIIRAAEVIEEEKMASVDSEHAETWAALYDILSTEEFATLYHAMQQKTFRNEEPIVKQGSMQAGLYFISNGKVKIFYKDSRGDILVKVAGKGEILGAETVFDASVWTISAVSMAKTDVMILKTGNLLKWRDDYPSLESKLSDYCMKSESLRAFFKVTGKDRRQTKRYKLSGRVNNMLLNSKKEETGITSKGDLFDISSGGVSFFLRISQKKNAKLLLGRNIKVTMAIQGTAKKQISIVGTIIAVRGHQAMENEYSVHVKFDADLTGTDVQAIVKAGKPV